MYPSASGSPTNTAGTSAGPTRSDTPCLGIAAARPSIHTETQLPAPAFTRPGSQVLPSVAPSMENLEASANGSGAEPGTSTGIGARLLQGLSRTRTLTACIPGLRPSGSLQPMCQ